MAYDRYRDDELGGWDDRRPCDDRSRERDRAFFRDGRDDHGPTSRLSHPRDRDRHAPIPTDETRDLISSAKVEGTPVYGRDDQRLGTVKALMIDKYEGQVRFAILSHASGFLGLDEEVVPVRWDELRYDERRGGYRVDFTSDDVRYTLERRRTGGRHGHNLDREWRG